MPTERPLLLADIARCTNEGCPLRACCRRSEPGHPAPRRQGYMHCEPVRTSSGWDCEDWLRAREVGNA